MGNPNQIIDNLIDYGRKYISGEAELYASDIISAPYYNEELAENTNKGVPLSETLRDKYLEEAQIYWIGQKPVERVVKYFPDEPVYGA